MGFKLNRLGRHLAGGVVTIAHGLVNRFENSVVAPPAPVLAGTAAVLAGAAFVKHLQNRKRNKPSTPATNKVRLLCVQRFFAYTLSCHVLLGNCFVLIDPGTAG